jgi:hypothetical protein
MIMSTATRMGIRILMPMIMRTITAIRMIITIITMTTIMGISMLTPMITSILTIMITITRRPAPTAESISAAVSPGCTCRG